MATDKFKIVTETLTDRSKVYSVHVASDDGGIVILACHSYKGANAVADALHQNVVDVSLRDAT